MWIGWHMSSIFTNVEMNSTFEELFLLHYFIITNGNFFSLFFIGKHHYQHNPNRTTFECKIIINSMSKRKKNENSIKEIFINHIELMAI